ncbi:hypothetical protein VTK26DRAFT_7251 [Humicola hyalothermophila]
MSKMPATALDLAVKKRVGPAPVTLLESDGTDSTSSAAPTVPSSPASFDGDHRTFSLKSRPWRRSFSNKDRDSTPEGFGGFRTHTRKISKSRPLSSSSHPDPPSSRRGSAVSDDHGRLSFSTADSLGVPTTASVSPIDWKLQHVAGGAPLEQDSHLLKTKSPYLVVTTDYLVKMKSRADALALFPALAADGSKREHGASPPEPLLVIPVAAIVSALVAESTRPSFGIEVWWKNPLSGPLFCRSDFFFSQPTEWHDLMGHLTRAIRANQQDDNTAARQCQDVEKMLIKIHEAEEPKFGHRKPDIFPVALRGRTRKEYMPKFEDAAKKPQESSAFYLVVGSCLCHLVQVQKIKGGEPVCRHKSYGLVTLESFHGEGISHEERFNITFRDPFKLPVTLELASRYYRQIIRVFGTADRFLKPVWPQLWQSREIFRVSGIKEPQYLVAREDFGSFKRTLDAYTAAYRCDSVDWEINWKTRFAPEFRLLPAKRGPYSPLQLLAVLRALRYNDYFNSLSFKDVDLSVLYGLEDNNSPRRLNAAYLSRTCIALGPEEVETLRNSPLLHQEFHALAFCSETIRQIDLRNCTKSLLSRHGPSISSTQLLTPILNLLRSGITKCNRLLLGGNILPPSDIEELADTMKTGAIQALDLSGCGLDDASLRDMVVTPLLEHPGPLESLSVSGNPGRLQARVLPSMLECLRDIRELNLGGSIQGDSYVEGSLLPFATLQCLEMLEELNISGYKVDEATLLDLERFLGYRSWMMDHQLLPRFRKLSLNNCGITGTQAARLFQAIGENRGMHLCLSGNPIENGIGDLASAIREQKGPAALDMEMIEFKEENNYLCLIKALTETKHLSLLSLAGTAPSPSSHGPCSQELVTTLRDLFARNASIRCLDLSGFCGKLDDGQLPKGFGRALSGLAHNTALTHLRIRNQNLHDDAGTLGRALAANTTLRALDCRDNSLNLTSLRFLVDNLVTHNTTIVHFPFPPAERRAIWKTILRGLQRTPSSVSVPALGTISSLSAASGSGPGGLPRNRDLLREEESLLRTVLDEQFALLDARLKQNRAAMEEAAAAAAAAAGVSDPLGLGLPADQLSQQQRRWQRHRHTNSTGFTTTTMVAGSGIDEEDEECWPTALAFTTPGLTPSTANSPHPDVSGPVPRPSSTPAEEFLRRPPTTESSSPTTAENTSMPDFAPYIYHDAHHPNPGRDPSSAASLVPLHTNTSSNNNHNLYRSGSGSGSTSSSSSVGVGVGGGFDSPTETLDPVSEVDTPPYEEEEEEEEEEEDLSAPAPPKTRVVPMVNVTVEGDGDGDGMDGKKKVEGAEGHVAGRGEEGEGEEEEEEEEVLLARMLREFRATGFGV